MTMLHIWIYPNTVNQLYCCCCWVAQLCPTLCNPMDCSTLGLSVPHNLPKLDQVHVHCIGDTIHPSHPLMPSSPFALNFSQHQGPFQWVNCLYQMTRILECQLQHQSFQWAVNKNKFKNSTPLLFSHCKVLEALL